MCGDMCAGREASVREEGRGERVRGAVGEETRDMKGGGAGEREVVRASRAVLGKGMRKPAEGEMWERGARGLSC